MDVTILDDETARRYEARVGDRLAGVLTYATEGRLIALLHTEVGHDHQGQGIGAALARFALDDARRRGRRVIVECPYVRAYVDRHPETLDVVVEMGSGEAEPG